MRRICSLCLTLTMIVVFSFGDVGLAYGAQEITGNIGQPEEVHQISDDADNCMPHAALVMFQISKTKSVNRSQVKSLLASGKSSVSDITVENLWTFDHKADLSTNTAGKKKYVRSGSGDEYTRVALVKSKSLSASQLVKTLNKRSDVKYAEPNYRIHACSVSNDPYVDRQWSMQDSTAENDTTPNISYEWTEKHIAGSNKIVAVVDTGVNYTHPDLEDNMWENNHYPTLKGECGYDFINGDADPMDDNGHGSHCAGIIGAVGDNGVGICGVNKDIRIMALKILDEEGSAWMNHEIAAYNYINKALDLGEPVVAINNSWGGGYSAIFGELAELVGEKGAVSVFAAGNEAADNDEEPGYPSNIESPYKITVAATDPDGSLAPYSNWGKKSVDVAAPGTAILSTVSYDCFNPSIYTSDEKDAIVANYNDFEDPANPWGNPTATDTDSQVYLNGERYDFTATDSKITIGLVPGGLPGDGEECMEFSCKGMKTDDLACFTIPYTIDAEQAESEPYFSVMCQPRGTTGDGIFAIADCQAEEAVSLNALVEKSIAGFYTADGESEWDHLADTCLLDDSLDSLIKSHNAGKTPDPCQRKLVVFLYAGAAGDYAVKLNDLAVSSQNLTDTKAFGQYDYMSGTSMATPFVSGAVALKAAELGDAADPMTLVNETVSMAKDGNLPILKKGILDFSKRPEILPPRIGKITVDQAKNTLTIKGSGLAPAGGPKVEIGDDEDHLTEAEIVGEPADRTLVVKNAGWINNIETVKVTSADNAASVRDDVYLVKGKKTLASKNDSAVDIAPTGAMATDGKKIYWTDSSQRNFFALNVKNLDDGGECVAFVDPKSIFKAKEKNTADYSMQFGPDLAYIGGSLYTVVEYGMSDASESSIDLFDDSDDSPAGDTESIYSGEFRLIKAKTGGEADDAVSLGKLPADLTQTADWTMASYNGKLYFIGGYSYAKDSKGFSTKVKIYDPASKKWSNGPALPEGRAGGKALQSGDKLIYTMGYSEAQKDQKPEDQKYPANLIFNGKKWTVSKASGDKGLEPLVIYGSARHGGNDYVTSKADISLVKGGLLYTGAPMSNYGDVLTYNAKGDAFKDTGYNFIKSIEQNEVRGIAVGGTYYGFSDDELYTLPVSSGLINVTAAKAKNGKISGTGSFMPGETAKVTVRASANYRIKTLKLNGKKQTVKKNQTKRVLTLKTLSADQKVTAAFEKYKFKVKVTKKGSGTVTGAKTYVKGNTATIKVKAKKGWYIKSITSGGKKIKVRKKAKDKTFKIKNIKKDVTVKVVFQKKK